MQKGRESCRVAIRYRWSRLEFQLKHRLVYNMEQLWRKKPGQEAVVRPERQAVRLAVSSEYNRG